MNYMPEIAKLLGVEIGEEFYLKGFDEDLLENMYVKKHKFFLKKDGLYYIDDIGQNVKSILLDDVISGTLEIIKFPKPILTDKEKKDLSGVIRPWRDKVESIRKFKSIFDGYEFLIIKVKTEVGISTTTLPYFKQGIMYKGMKLNKEYSLKELGL